MANNSTDGHYLNLPVMNEAGEIVGMVDVLKLTYATLEQVREFLLDAERVLSPCPPDQWDADSG